MQVETPAQVQYASLICDWLAELDYTHCFFVAGGNIMHLLNASRTKFKCIPVVHEVAAGIAVEYFNEITDEGRGRAFALVTAGPGLTNMVTAFAGAFLESRELLVLGGQVKSVDLKDELRQRGIQEVDGVSIVRPITLVSERIVKPVPRDQFKEWVKRGRTGRKGPVFLEFCLDAQGAIVKNENFIKRSVDDTPPKQNDINITKYAEDIIYSCQKAHRPVFLIGGGVSRKSILQIKESLEKSSIAVMTTWNGADRIDNNASNFFGRPNTWGQRSANILLQQADLIVAFGARLGLQQTGFNVEAFAPFAKIIQIDIDDRELSKKLPHVDVKINADANTVLLDIFKYFDSSLMLHNHDEWLEFCKLVRKTLPTVEHNDHKEDFIDPFEFAQRLSQRCSSDDIIIPCSSGGAFTTMMQSFEIKFGQKFATSKGLASMGYGLSAAIGTAFAFPRKRVILCEGDGGFSQNLQELATVSVNNLPIKMFIYSNEGYASIRMTQKNYFSGSYIGCDTKTGLGFPIWSKLFDAYDIQVLLLKPGWENDRFFLNAFKSDNPIAFILPIDPEQTYYPKISSQVTSSGSMESSPLHLMIPVLSDNIAAIVFPYLSLKSDVS